jgi:hypothetical protein
MVDDPIERTESCFGSCQRKSVVSWGQTSCWKHGRPRSWKGSAFPCTNTDVFPLLNSPSLPNKLHRSIHPLSLPAHTHQTSRWLSVAQPFRPSPAEPPFASQTAVAAHAPHPPHQKHRATATIMPYIIEASQLGATREQWEVMFPGTGCQCGWYHFYYAGCGHLYNRPHRVACGMSSSHITGQPVFCERPGPIVHVYHVRIQGLCPQCQT